MYLMQSGAVLLLGVIVAVTQDEDDERKKQREFEREIDKALAEFRKTYSGKDFERADAMKKLSGMKHEKVVQEVAKFATTDTDIVREVAIGVLAELNHPKSAEALAAAFKVNLTNKKILEALLKAMEKMQWDVLILGSTALVDDFVKDATTEKSTMIWTLMQTMKKVRAIVALEPMIKLLKKTEEMAKANPAEGNVKFKEENILVLKGLSGQNFTTHKDWESWYKQASAQLQQNAIIVHWCEKSWAHWEKLATEKRKCPHHQDEKKKSTAKELPCMYKPK